MVLDGPQLLKSFPSLRLQVVEWSSDMEHPAIALAMHILSTIFLVGMLGSAVVVAISFVEDLYELFGE
jgi:hypothetical protein